MFHCRKKYFRIKKVHLYKTQ